MVTQKDRLSPSEQAMIRVLLVDDHTVVRQGTRELLLHNPGFIVVGELDQAKELIQSVQTLKPDVVLLDIQMPGDNGLVALEKLRQVCPSQRVVLLTAFNDTQYLRRGLELKANGYLSKMVTEPELISAIRQVVSGDFGVPVYSADIEEKLAEEQKRASEQTPLSAREHEILLLVAQGMTNRQIGELLFVSTKTVDTHVAKLIKKIGVHNRSQLTAFAYEQGYLSQ